MGEEITTRGERTRAEILGAAHRLFIEQGYHGTSMRQIAEQAGIALGGIYNHFASKEDIFAAVFLEHHPYREVLPALRAAHGETVEEFVRSAARKMLEALNQRPDILKLTFIEIVELQGRHLAQLFADLQPQLFEIMQRVGRVPGRLRPIPIPIIIRSFIGLFFSYYITELVLANRLPAEFQANALDYFVDIYLHGILADDESPGESTE